MTVFARVQAALGPLGLPVSAQVYIPATGEDWPARYLTYFLVTSPSAQHADNQETQRINRVQVNYFDRDGLDALPDVDGAMTAAGFRLGPKFQLPYSRETRHFGLAQEYVDHEEN